MSDAPTTYLVTAKQETADQQSRNLAALADWKERAEKADRYDLANALRMVEMFERRIKIANGVPVEPVKKQKNFYLRGRR